MSDVGIKETQEAVEALKQGSMIIKKAVKGGVSAIPSAILEAAGKYPVFLDGYKGADQIKAELSNLSKEEIITIFVSVFEGVKDFENV